MAIFLKVEVEVVDLEGDSDEKILEPPNGEGHTSLDPYWGGEAHKNVTTLMQKSWCIIIYNKSQLK